MKVEFEDGVLTVEGERKQEKEEKGKKFHKIERGYGKFVRRFALPTEVDAAKVSAEFKEGVLNVHLPKSPNAKPKATVSRSRSSFRGGSPAKPRRSPMNGVTSSGNVHEGIDAGVSIGWSLLVRKRRNRAQLPGVRRAASLVF